MSKEFTEDEFWKAYKQIYKSLTFGIEPSAEKCTIILGGQPGAGKSSFYEMNDNILNYIPINGDDFRRFHPNISNIIKYDQDNYAERTQSFSNKVVEQLIKDLSSDGYNLIIEGTLRNPEVPIKTCCFLLEKGYKPDLVVIVCNAETAWQSTIHRAEMMKEKGMIPRFVPIDIYNKTVHQIPESLKLIEEAKCFDSIVLIKRDGEVLYNSSNNSKSAVEYLKEELNLSDWDARFADYEKEYIETKISILQDKLSELDKESDKDKDDDDERGI